MWEYIDNIKKILKSKKRLSKSDKRLIFDKIDKIINDLNDINLKYEYLTLKGVLDNKENEFETLILAFLEDLSKSLINGGYDDVLYTHKKKTQLLRLDRVYKFDLDKLSLQSKFIMLSTSISGGALVLFINYFLSNLDVLVYQTKIMLLASLMFFFISGLLGIVVYFILANQINVVHEQFTYYFDEEWISDMEMLGSAANDYKSYIELNFKWKNRFKSIFIMTHIVAFLLSIGLISKLLFNLLFVS